MVMTPFKMTSASIFICHASYFCEDTLQRLFNTLYSEPFFKHLGRPLWCFPAFYPLDSIHGGGVMMERKERLNEKYGWVLFLGLGLLWLVVGLTRIFNPEGLAANEAQRIAGVSLSELDASYPSPWPTAKNTASCSLMAPRI